METIKLDLIPGKKMPSLHASQYDDGRDYHIDLTENRAPYTLDGTETISLTVRKCDNTLVTMDIANTFADKSYIEFRTTEQMNACAGFNYGEITIEKNGTQISSLNFYLQVEGAPDEGGIQSQSEINNLARQVHDIVVEELEDNGASETGYDNTESGLEATNVQDAIDELASATPEDVYTKEEANGKFATKTALQTVANAIPTKTSDLQNDSDFATMTEVEEELPEIATPIISDLIPTVIGDDYYDKTETDTLLNDKASVITKHSDLLYDKPYTDKKFISNLDGSVSTNNSFCTFFDIDIPENCVRLYPYNNDGTHLYIRSICFFDKNGDFISGVSGSDDSVVNGVAVPSGSKTLACSLKYADTTTLALGTHYLTPTSIGDTISETLNPVYEVEADSIKGQPKTNNIRKACFNFQFDDGNVKDTDIKAIFDTFGYKCGFAVISNALSDVTTRNRYLSFQSAGYEILCHADNGTAMNDTTVSPEVIENRLSSSKGILELAGFKIKGFVTPDSTMADVFKPILRKYYQWADTVYFGAYSGTGKPYMDAYDGAYNIYRVSLQSTTLANAKAVVDLAIANYGIVTFYGHAATLDTDNYLTTQNLTELLAYIQTKVEAGNCIIGTPSEVIQNFFEVRNDDVSYDWVSLTPSDVSLDARFNAHTWKMSYSKKQKLLAFAIRLNPKENISGQINPVFMFPFRVDGQFLVQSETGRNCFIYDNGLLIQGNDSWATGTNYRFSALIKLE